MPRYGVGYRGYGTRGFGYGYGGAYGVGYRGVSPEYGVGFRAAPFGFFPY